MAETYWAYIGVGLCAFLSSLSYSSSIEASLNASTDDDIAQLCESSKTIDVLNLKNISKGEFSSNDLVCMTGMVLPVSKHIQSRAGTRSVALKTCHGHMDHYNKFSEENSIFDSVPWGLGNVHEKCLVSVNCDESVESLADYVNAVVTHRTRFEERFQLHVSRQSQISVEVSEDRTWLEFFSLLPKRITKELLVPAMSMCSIIGRISIDGYGNYTISSHPAVGLSVFSRIDFTQAALACRTMARLGHQKSASLLVASKACLVIALVGVAAIIVHQTRYGDAVTDNVSSQENGNEESGGVGGVQASSASMSSGSELNLSSEASHHNKNIVIDDDSLSAAALTCVVCISAPRNTVLKPCCHFHLCTACANLVRDCPICRVCFDILIYYHSTVCVNNWSVFLCFFFPHQARIVSREKVYI
jgi:hypothetical protein